MSSGDVQTSRRRLTASESWHLEVRQKRRKKRQNDREVRDIKKKNPPKKNHTQNFIPFAKTDVSSE